MTTEGSRPAMARSVYVASAVCAVGALLFGYGTGVISGAALYVKGPLGSADSAFFQGLVASGLLGALVSGTLSARRGRRRLALAAARERVRRGRLALDLLARHGADGGMSPLGSGLPGDLRRFPVPEGD